MKAYNILNMGANKERAVYGYLYNWYAVSDANFAPTNWKVPTKTEWETLITYLGGATVAGGKLKETGTTYWTSPNTGADNSSGFTAYGGGIREGSDSASPGLFRTINDDGYFHSQTDYISGFVFMLFLTYTNDDAFIGEGYTVHKTQGQSVRLLWDGVGTPDSVVYYENRPYDVIQIGTQYWMLQNWAGTYLNNGTPIPNVTDDTAWSALTTPGRCAYNNDESYV